MVSISRARGATFSWASLRTVAWSSASSGGRSKAIGRRAYRPTRPVRTTRRVRHANAEMGRLPIDPALRRGIMGLGGRQGDNVTTTGGPEHSLADPATSEQSAGRSGRRSRPREPARRRRHRRRARTRRSRIRVARVRRGRRSGAIVAVLVVGGVAIAVAARRDPTARAASNVRSVAPVSPPAAHPTPQRGRAETPAEASAAAPTPSRRSRSTRRSRFRSRRPAVAPPAPVAGHHPRRGQSPRPPPPVTTPPVEPTSVLQWTATPAALSIKGGGHTSVHRHRREPDRRARSRCGTPLSCAPALRGPHGAAFGGGVCAQMAQIDVAALERSSQRYTIYATDTADASGRPLPPGRLHRDVREPVQDQGATSPKSSTTRHRRCTDVPPSSLDCRRKRYDCSAARPANDTGWCDGSRAARPARTSCAAPDGRRVVVKWELRPSSRVLRRKAVGLTDRLREQAGWPVPHQCTVESDGCLFVIQDLLPGAPVELLTHGLVDRLLDLHATRLGLERPKTTRPGLTY